MTNTGYILGIDPDVEKSGFTLIDCKYRELIFCKCLTMPEAFEYLKQLPSSGYTPVKVVIEDSDQATGWHYSRRDSQPVVFAKGRSVGMCHATLRHLHEYAEQIGLDCVMKKPLRLIWGRGGEKISQREIEQFIPNFPKRSNPEMRDSALLAWDYADLPQRLRIIRPLK